MVARRRTLGALALVMTSPDRTFGKDDVDLAEDLAARAALAMDNVRLYQQEHSVADTLQRSLLPELPDVPGIESAAHYVSASSAADVGGDFYDLLAPPGRVRRHRDRGRRRPRRRRRGGHGPPARRAARGRLGGRGHRPRRRARPGGPAGPGAAGRLARDHGLRPGRPAGRARATRGGCTSPTPATRRCCCAPPTARVRIIDGVTGLLVGVDALHPPADALPRRAERLDADRLHRRADRAAGTRHGRRHPRRCASGWPPPPSAPRPASSATRRSAAPSTIATTSR